MKTPGTPWIKMRTNLVDDPKISAMAEQLGLDSYAVVGRVFAFWCWADQYTEDGNGLVTSSAWIDERFKCLGLASAMRKVGWLAGQEGALSLPEYEKHNGKSLRNRLLTAQRVAKHRVTVVKRNSNGKNVTHVTDSLSLSLNSIPEGGTKHPKAGFTPPTLAEVAAYGKSRGGKIDAKVFWEYFEAANPPWTDKSGKPVRAWKQKFITWESNGVESRPAGQVHLAPRLAN